MTLSFSRGLVRVVPLVPSSRQGHWAGAMTACRDTTVGSTGAQGEG